MLFGMISVTCFGLLFTPAFYTFMRKRETLRAALSPAFCYSSSLLGGKPKTLLK